MALKIDRLNMVAHTYSPALRKQRQDDLEFKSYTISMKLGWPT